MGMDLLEALDVTLHAKSLRLDEGESEVFPQVVSIQMQTLPKKKNQDAQTKSPLVMQPSAQPPSGYLTACSLSYPPLQPPHQLEVQALRALTISPRMAQHIKMPCPFESPVPCLVRVGTGSEELDEYFFTHPLASTGMRSG